LQESQAVSTTLLWVDVIDDDESEGVFLQKVASKINSQDRASSSRDDIIHKLPKPKTPGGST